MTTVEKEIDSLHRVMRRSMFWRSKTLGLVNISQMSNQHIIGVIKTINVYKTNETSNIWNGHTQEEWLYALKRELNYRDKLINTMIKPFQTTTNGKAIRQPGKLFI